MLIPDDKIKELVKLCEANSDLRDKLRKAPDLEAFVELAKEAGVEISAADWVRSQALKTIELSDEELEKVAGGNWVTVITVTADYIDKTTVVISGPDKSGTWGSFAHSVC